MRNKQYSSRSRKIAGKATGRWPVFSLSLLLALPALAGGAASGAERTPPLEPGDPASFPLREGSLVYRDPRLPGKWPARRWEQFLPRASWTNDERYGRLKDPRRNLPYQYRLQVRCLVEGEEAIGGRRFVIHFNDSSDEPLARRVGGVLARLYWLARDYLGRVAPPSERGASHVDVWLEKDGRAGGEELSGHLYLTGIDTPRPPAEWVRELAHEYAHLTLPVVGPYTEPEKWANGYLGERLFLKWLLVDNGVTDLWDQPINAQGYLTHQIAPFRARFLEAGPDARDADRMDGSGMEFFIGTVLALEATHGPVLLRALFNHVATPRPQNLGANLDLALGDLQTTPLPLDPAAFIPSSVRPTGARVESDGLTVRRVAYWVYLTGGQWRIEAEGDLPSGTVVRVEDREIRASARRPSAGGRAWTLSISTNNGMWRRLEFVAPSGDPLTLRAVRLVRAGP